MYIINQSLVKKKHLNLLHKSYKDYYKIRSYNSSHFTYNL